MPAIIAALMGALYYAAGSIAIQVMISLGMAAVTYTGVDTVLTWAKSMALTNIAALPAQTIALVAFLKIGVCINMVVSATAMRLTLSGFTSGTMKRWIKK